MQIVYYLLTSRLPNDLSRLEGLYLSMDDILAKYPKIDWQPDYTDQDKTLGYCQRTNKTFTATRVTI